MRTHSSREEIDAGAAEESSLSCNFVFNGRDRFHHLREVLRDAHCTLLVDTNRLLERISPNVLHQREVTRYKGIRSRIEPSAPG